MEVRASFALFMTVCWLTIPVKTPFFSSALYLNGSLYPSETPVVTQDISVLLESEQWFGSRVVDPLERN